MALNPSSSLARLFDAPVRPGVVVWIGLRPARAAPIDQVESAELETGRGLVGDRFTRLGGARQVTLIAAESLAAVASCLGVDAVSPETTRRNIVTRGINLLALKDRRFRIGDALLETSGECHPCSLMEQLLGVGGYNAMRGHGGITARVIAGGQIRIGDSVTRVDRADG